MGSGRGRQEHYSMIRDTFFIYAETFGEVCFGSMLRLALILVSEHLIHAS